jgi:predicted O-methyltransferase YrrM
MPEVYEYQIPLEPMCTAIAEKAVHDYGALQDEWEFGILLDLVKLHGVRTMVEIGSYTGGSLWAWRQVVPNVMAVTMDSGSHFHSHGASMIFGDSTDPTVQARMEQRLNGIPVDFVFIDGGHDMITAMSDFQWARKLVSHGIIGLHDINLHIRFPQPEFTGPRQLWDEAREHYPTFEIANVRHEDPGVGIFWIR